MKFLLNMNIRREMIVPLQERGHPHARSGLWAFTGVFRRSCPVCDHFAVKGFTPRGNSHPPGFGLE